MRANDADGLVLADDPYAMANLRPGETGLPMVVWVSERGNARHDARVKVCRVHGPSLQWDNTASVAVRPQPHLAAGQLDAADLAVVARWIALNEAALIAYWDGAIGTSEMLQRLVPLPP